jgi:hypothetical protein
VNPKWAIILGKKIDKMADEMLRFAQVTQTIRKMNEHRINRTLNQLKTQSRYFKGKNLFSPILSGEGTYELHKSDDFTFGASAIKKNNIMSELVIVGKEACQKGLWEQFKEALASILRRLKGLREDEVITGIEKFIEVFKEQLSNINIQVETQTDGALISQTIENLLGTLDVNSRNRLATETMMR